MTDETRTEKPLLDRLRMPCQYGGTLQRYAWGLEAADLIERVYHHFLERYGTKDTIARIGNEDAILVFEKLRAAVSAGEQRK